MKKKFIIIASIIIVVLIALVVLINHFFTKAFENPVIASLPKSESSDCYYSEGFQDYTDYCKYYYNEDILDEFSKSIYFESVTDTDIEEIKSYFDNFKDRVEYEEYKDKYDFEANCIDTSDYIYIENKDTCEKYAHYPDKYAAYNVYFFDAQSLTLFFIHSNI